MATAAAAMTNVHKDGTAMDASAGEGAEKGSANGRPVDLVHLSRSTLGNQELEREVLQLFCVQARIYFERLEAAADRTAWAEAAHTIKGSAKGIGAWAVAWAAETAEQQRDAPAGEHAVILRDQLRGAIDDACAFIDELLGEH